MSGDEALALAVSILIGIYGWQSLMFFKPLPRTTVWLAFLTPVICAAILFAVLRLWSSEDVRHDATYLLFYMVLGFGWLGIMNRLLAYAGLLCRDDVLERGNVAAGLAFSGALVGLTLAFAGANIGNGPGWWVVIFCAAIATAPLFLLWIVGNAISRIEEAITIDRDVAAGWRAFGFFIAGGLIAGRAVAGDWHSTRETVVDFARAGCALPLLAAVAVVIDCLGRPTPDKPVRNVFLLGVLPGLAYLAAAIAVVKAQGTW